MTSAPVRSPAGTLRPGTRRLGIMGGTFDPIHVGHLVVASDVARLLALDEVVFVPAGEPWQKADRSVTDAEDRYLMTVLATADDPRFWVSRVDIDRRGPTYTVDTLADLRRIVGPDVELFFITGADAVGQILTWRDPHEILRLATLVAVTRPGHHLRDPGLDAPVHFVEVTGIDLSSSECRRRVAAGEPIRYLVPAGVEGYITKRGLYAEDRG